MCVRVRSTFVQDEAMVRVLQAYSKSEVIIMSRGDKDKYTDKQKRQAEHIEEGYKKQGVSAKEAGERAWRTVNKESGGGKKSGSGRKKS